MPRSLRHVFYDRVQELLSEAGFDAFVEEIRLHTSRISAGDDQGGGHPPAGPPQAELHKRSAEASRVDPEAGPVILIHMSGCLRLA
jgi:hypothetical protein